MFDHEAWPDVPRTCFGPGDGMRLNACVGWVLSFPGGMHGYIEGYRRAADAVYHAMASTGSSPDHAVFPLAFLWRHHIELALKEIIALGRSCAEEDWGFPPHHHLDKLWAEARGYVVDCGSDDSPEIRIVEAGILELNKVDPGGDGFRYPLNRKGTDRSLPDVPDTVNIRDLHLAMTAISNFLSGVSSELGVRLEYIADARNYR